MGNDSLQRAARDPVYFAYAFLGWHAHPRQAEWLRGSCKRQNWCRAANRWGKTEAIAIKHLWKCTFKIRPEEYSFDEYYETASVALSLDQAVMALSKAWRLIHKPEAESFRKAFIRRMVHTPFPKIEWNYDSIWWARSTAKKGVYLEGKDYDYVTYDEAALDPDFGYVLDNVMRLRLLDRQGDYDIISIGRRGSEFNRRYAFACDDPGQFTLQGKTEDNPTINRDDIEELKRTLDPGLVEERLMGGERGSDGVIGYESIMKAISNFEVNGPYELSPFRMKVPAQAGRRYSTGWDLAKERDYAVGWTFDITDLPFQLVSFEKFNKHTITAGGTGGDSYWSYVESRIRACHATYGGLITVDATGLGVVVADHLSDLGIEAFVFTGQKLVELIGCLSLAYGRGIVAHPHLEGLLPNGRRWTLIDELEEVNDKLTSLDTATAIALSLWSVREWITSGFPVSLVPRIAGVRNT